MNKNNFGKIRDRLTEYAGKELADHYMKELMEQDKDSLSAIQFMPWHYLRPLLDEVESSIKVVQDTELARYMNEDKKIFDVGNGKIAFVKN